MHRDSKTPRTQSNDTAPAERRQSPVINNNTGRVTHDDLGNAIWEWATTTGASTDESATTRLKRLDNPHLSLAEDTPTPFDAVRKNPQGTVKGYSPYDSGLLAKKAATRRKDLRKLSEWLKLKKQAASSKPDEE